MDQLTDYRLDQSEKRAETADARMARMEAQLTQIQISIAGLATKDSVRNWGMTLTAIIVATGIGVGAMMMQSLGTQISASRSVSVPSKPYHPRTTSRHPKRPQTSKQELLF